MDLLDSRRRAKNFIQVYNTSDKYLKSYIEISSNIVSTCKPFCLAHLHCNKKDLHGFRIKDSEMKELFGDTCITLSLFLQNHRISYNQT